MKKLCKKDLIFASELADKINPRSAAMIAYGRGKLDEKVKEAYQIVRRTEFQSEVEKEHEARDLVWQVRRHHLAQRLMRLADGDLRDLYDEDGNPKNPKDLTYEEQYLIKKCKSKTTFDPESESIVTYYEYELYDRITAMTRIQALFGLDANKNKESEGLEQIGQGLAKLVEYNRTNGNGRNN